MNYKVIEDAFYSTIEATNEPLGDPMVFKTLTEAKKYIIGNLRVDVTAYQDCIKYINNLKKSNLKP